MLSKVLPVQNSTLRHQKAKVKMLKFCAYSSDYKFLNLNLIKKSLFTILTNIPNAKNIRNDITKFKDIDTLNEYFLDPSIWN